MLLVSRIYPALAAQQGSSVGSARALYRPGHHVGIPKLSSSCSIRLPLEEPQGGCWRLASSMNDQGMNQDMELDPDFMEALNEVSNKVLKVMMSSNEHQVKDVSDELEEMKLMLLKERDLKTVQFLNVMQGLLNHTVLKESENMEGVYMKAFNRICNVSQSSNWQLAQEGKSPEVNDEPSFSTWDDVLNGRKPKKVQRTSPLETAFYDLLGVHPEAPDADIKASYRKLALKWHPDVNDSPGAEETFKNISQAYDVLSDVTARKLYNEHGAEGMKTHKGSSSGAGNSDRFWSEFKPYKRENKHTKARDATGNASGGVNSESTPMPGYIVEYPLSDVIKNELMDGREKGVGLLVGRNMDRGDAKNLPADQLDICEVEPLRQEEVDSNRWIPDEIGYSAFCKIDELTVVPVVDYDRRFDIWVINAPLSEGCAGPELVEEIIV